MKPLTVEDECPDASIVSEVASATPEFASARCDGDRDRDAVMLKVGHFRVTVHARYEKCDTKNGQSYNEEGSDSLTNASSVNLDWCATKHGY